MLQIGTDPWGSTGDSCPVQANAEAYDPVMGVLVEI